MAQIALDYSAAQINAAIAKINSLVSIIEDNIVQLYDDTTAIYPVTFIKAVYNENNKTLDNILKDLEDKIVETKEIELSNVGYVNKSHDYNITVDRNWCYSDFINLHGITSIFAHIKGSSSGNVVLISFYSEANTASIISYVNDREINGTVNIPEGAKYVRFSGATEAFGGYKPEVMLSASIITFLSDQISYISSAIVETKSLIDENLEKGLIDISGAESFNGDSNWNRTGYISLSGIMEIDYAVKSSNVQKALIAYYKNNGDTNCIDYIPMSRGKEISGKISSFPKEANYFRMSFKSARYGDYTPIINIKEVEITKKVSDNTLFPSTIYLVCNDVNNNAYDRNLSPAIYLDHCFENLNESKDLNFDGVGVKYTFSFKTSANSNWNAVLNGGNNINITNKNIKILGNNAPDNLAFDVKIISTKATPSKDKIPCVLVLGSSTVYGEGATFISNGMQSIKPYHAICYELFKKDNIDQGVGNSCILLGTIKHANLSFNYKNNEYTYDDYCEGYRGQTINGFMSMKKFTNDDGEFSLLSWVEKYRTLDDNGQRLYFDSSKGNIGTAGSQNLAYLETGELATDEEGNQLYIGSLVSNTLLYNVCKPTHVISHLGANGGATTEQIQSIINSIKNDFPNCYIALAMNDSMGTIFPDKYHDISASMCRWNITNLSDNRHKQNFNIQKIYEENFNTDNYKLQKVYVLPFFFVASPIFFSVRQSNLPEYDYNGEDSKHLEPFGWYSASHADIRAHCNYAYQLYAWLKYTLTLEI